MAVQRLPRCVLSRPLAAVVRYWHVFHVIGGQDDNRFFADLGVRSGKDVLHGDKVARKEYRNSSRCASKLIDQDPELCSVRSAKKAVPSIEWV